MYTTQRKQAIDILKSPAEYSMEAVNAALRMIRLKADISGEALAKIHESGENHEHTSH